MTRKILTTMIQRGQVTVPAAVRRLLGAKPRDMTAVRIEGSTIRVVPIELTLDQVFGSDTPVQRPEDFGERFRSANAETANRPVREQWKL